MRFQACIAFMARDSSDMAILHDSGTVSSCIFKISNSETLAKREFTPAILFLFGLRIFHSVEGE